MENRKNRFWYFAVIAAGIIFLAALGGAWWLISTTQPSLTGKGAGSTPASPAAREIASTLGDTLFGYGYIVTVDDTDHSDIFIDQFSASENHTMRAYHVIMESNSPTGIEVNPHFWRLFDSQTTAYPPIFAGKDPSLTTAKSLAKGEILQGWVTFEVPKGANHFRLAYDIPNISEKVSFVFDVG